MRRSDADFLFSAFAEKESQDRPDREDDVSRGDSPSGGMPTAPKHSPFTRCGQYLDMGRAPLERGAPGRLSESTRDCTMMRPTSRTKAFPVWSAAC